MKIQALQNIVGFPSGKKEILKEFQNTNDIIHAVLEQHQINKNAFTKIAKHFDDSDDYTVCRKLWEFVHYNLNYKAEPNLQTVKSVSKMLYDANGKGNDCKHFSGFIAGCLDALDIPFVYRFAAYDGKIPTHVYVVAKCGDQNVICDAVLPYFDSEKSPTYKIDIDPKKKNNMPLVRMSGFAQIGYTTAQKIEHTAAIVGAAASRAAFDALLLLNVHGLATKMQEALNKNSAKVESLWYKFGGDFNKLKTNVAKGAAKKRILGVPSGIDQNDNTVSPDYSNKIGFDPVTVSAAITAATPIVVAVIALFKQLNINSNDVSTDLTDYSGSGYQDYTTQYQQQQATTQFAGNTLLLLGGAAVIAFLIFKNK